MMKGQGLPITLLIIILLSVIVAVGVIILWTGGWAGLTGIYREQAPGNRTLVETTVNTYLRDCTNWRNAGCIGNAPDIEDYGLDDETLTAYGYNAADLVCVC